MPLVIITCWSLNIWRDLEPQGQKGIEDHQSNMENERIMGMEEIENGQQGMQEKLSQVTKMVTILIKGKGITEDPSLRENLHLGKITIHPLCQIQTTFVNKES